MSKAKQTGSQRRGSPAGTPERDRRQMVITLDKRFLYVVLAILAMVVALVAGILVGQSGSSAPAAPAASVPQAAEQAAAQSGLVVSTRSAPSIPGLDPNLEGFQVAMASESFTGGPRVGVSDVDKLSTFDFGDIPADKLAEHTFKLKNVGDQDLTITQVHTSCGCTIPSVAGRTMDTDGKLDSPLILKPGQEQEVFITYDPQALKDEGTISKFVQVFSNDATGIQGETRFRLTGNVVTE
jgi:hypothetical protein